MKNLIWGILVIISIPIFGQANSTKFSEDKRDKCYAKVFKKDEYEEDEMTLFLYIGKETKNIELDTLYFKLKEATNQLIYLGWMEDLENLGIDENADDLEQYVFVQDTSETQEVIQETFEYSKLIQKGGFTEWAEILCDFAISTYLVLIKK